MLLSCTRYLAAVALFATVASAQNSKQVSIVRDFCIKVAPEKAAQFESFIHEFVMPMDQARVASGSIAGAMLLRSVIPMGRSAACDYRGVSMYQGFPGDPDANDAISAAFKQAKLNMTAGEMLAKLNSMSELEGVEYWLQQSRAEGGASGIHQGSYVRLNHYKASDVDEWLRLETTYWKPLIDERLKQGGNLGWSAWAMWIPGGGGPGDSKPYNALTVDLVGDWHALAEGIGLPGLWAKVHPHEEMTAFFDAYNKVVSTYDREIYKVIDIATPAERGTK